MAEAGCEAIQTHEQLNVTKDVVIRKPTFKQFRISS